ncbi:hypothetical protein A8B84_19325 [Marinobacter sp. EhC06]|jgi:integrase|uniref:tyrosine-type recombinase/integrase n=1 Tax=Marinobacter TaxID=2742 RepID=UPI0007D90EE9|nr:MULTISPECIES: site-specific integrase [unclassified Marinobacter]OAN92566.1 hypothetical protein A8B80_00215 [Marinobacter sp. EhN04]OAN95115.1 hypothetical protein A8B84_19325 [Marinobacter sp. EhC06]
MPINKRGKGFEASVSYKGERKRKLLPTREMAEIWAVQEKQRLVELYAEGELKPKGRGVTLAELRREVIKYVWQYQKSKKTAELNSATVCKAFGDETEIASITMGDIEEQISAWKHDGKADGTINRLLSALSKMLSYAVDKDYLTKAPRIPRLKEVNGRIRFLTGEEENELLAFFEFINASTMHDICVVGLDTGMRQGEILGLQVRDLDLANGQVVIWENKTDHPRTIPLTDRARRVLKAAVSGKKQTDSVFDTTRDSIRHYWDRARNHLGYGSDKQYVFHMLRHTFCSRLAQKNVNISAIQALAGHKTITMTQRYAHLSTKALHSAIGVLNQ